MTYEEFHNATRTLWNIDRFECPEAFTCDEDWQAFRDHPHQWFVRASDERASRIFAVIEARQRRKTA